MRGFATTHWLVRRPGDEQIYIRRTETCLDLPLRYHYYYPTGVERAAYLARPQARSEDIGGRCFALQSLNGAEDIYYPLGAGGTCYADNAIRLPMALPHRHSEREEVPPPALSDLAMREGLEVRWHNGAWKKPVLRAGARTWRALSRRDLAPGAAAADWGTRGSIVMRGARWEEGQA